MIACMGLRGRVKSDQHDGMLRRGSRALLAGAVCIAVTAGLGQKLVAQEAIVSAPYYDAELIAAVQAFTQPEVPPSANVLALPAGTLGSIEDLEPTDGAGDDLRVDPSDRADPLERFNRVMFTVNDTLDVAILKPAATAYRFLVPSVLRQGVANILANAASPVTLINDLLQGEGDRAQTTLVRFAMNSTVGVGGFLDVAAQNGFAQHSEDFDQTMAVYGIKSGPYIVLPLFGPSTLRHAVGRVADAVTTPTTWLLMDAAVVESMSPTMAQTMVSRESALDQIDSLRQTSPDYYAAVRDLYFQYREAEIRNGRIDVEELSDIPDVSE